MKTFRRALTTTVIALAATAAASADSTISYNFNIGPSSTDLNNATTTVQSFDPGVGGVPANAVLVSYTIHGSSDLFATITVKNNSLVTFQPGSNVSETSFLGLNIGAPLTLNDTHTNFNSNLISGVTTLSPTLDVSGLAPGGTVGPTLVHVSTPFDLTVVCGVCSGVQTPPAGDPLTLYFSTFSSQAQSLNGANSITTYATTAQVSGTITYDYTVPAGTPEPVTMALVGGGLIALGLFRKKIKS